MGGEAIAGGLVGGLGVMASLLGLFVSSDYRVQCTFQIDNKSQWKLTDPVAIAKGGRIEHPPAAIDPGNTGTMGSHKTPYTPSGSRGTVSWNIDNGKDYRLVVMWDAPFNFDYHSNTLAVGIMKTKTDVNGKMWYPEIEQGSSYETALFDFMNGDSSKSQFSIKEYYKHIESIRYVNNVTGVLIKAAMGTSHKPVIHIQVFTIPQ